MPNKSPKTAGLPYRVQRELVEKNSWWKFAFTVQCLVKVGRIQSFQPPDVLDVLQSLYASLCVAGHARDLSDPPNALRLDVSIVLPYSFARRELRSCLGSASLTHPTSTAQRK